MSTRLNSLTSAISAARCGVASALPGEQIANRPSVVVCCTRARALARVACTQNTQHTTHHTHTNFPNICMLCSHSVRRSWPIAIPFAIITTTTLRRLQRVMRSSAQKWHVIRAKYSTCSKCVMNNCAAAVQVTLTRCDGDLRSVKILPLICTFTYTLFVWWHVMWWDRR